MEYLFLFFAVFFAFISGLYLQDTSRVFSALMLLLSLLAAFLVSTHMTGLV